MKPSMLAIGNALLDYFYFINTPFTYTSQEMDMETLDTIIKGFDNGVIVAGGCAANSARVFMALGGEAYYIGAVGTDKEAVLYRQDLEAINLPCLLFTKEGRTGKFIVIINENERKIYVNSGVASQFTLPYETLASKAQQTDIIHIDGFIGTNPENLEDLIGKVIKTDKPFCFDAGGRKICQKNKELFKKIIDRSAYTFVNNDEYEALFDAPVGDSLKAVSRTIPGLLIVKRDAQGAVCYHHENLIESPVRSVKPLDETGAGDSFAAGFLFGVLKGLSLPQCMRFGNTVASHVISIPGIKVNETYIKEIARLFTKDI